MQLSNYQQLDFSNNLVTTSLIRNAIILFQKQSTDQTF